MCEGSGGAQWQGYSLKGLWGADTWEIKAKEGRTSVSALPDPSRHPGVFVAGVWGLIETRVISSSERWSQPTVKIRLYLFGTIGRNEPARPIPASILKEFPMSVSKREGGMPRAPLFRGACDGGEGAVLLQVEIPGYPPIQSHDCSSMSSSR